MTWGWVNDQESFIGKWTNPLRQEFLFTFIFILYIWLLKPASCHANNSMHNITAHLHEVELLNFLLMSYTQYVSICASFHEVCVCVCVCEREREKGGECSDTVYEGPSVSWHHKDTFKHKHTQTYTVWLQPQINDQEWFDLSKSHSREHDFR